MLTFLERAPPDVLRVNEKFLREYYIFNVIGFIITTNHRTDGIYLPADDRRHYVAWSERSPTPPWVRSRSAATRHCASCLHTLRRRRRQFRLYPCRRTHMTTQDFAPCVGGDEIPLASRPSAGFCPAFLEECARTKPALCLRRRWYSCAWWAQLGHLALDYQRYGRT